MARARNIKPGFFKNEELAELGAEAMLLFAGLWTLADRAGRLEDRPKRIKAELFPYWPEIQVDTLLSSLNGAGFIERYEVAGSRYLSIPNFGKHQNPHKKEVASTIPAPGEHRAGTVQDPEIPERAGLVTDSLLLIPDSLKPSKETSAADAADPPALTVVEPVPLKYGRRWFDEQHERWYSGYWCKRDKAASRRAFEKRVKQLVATGRTHEESVDFLIERAQFDRSRFEGSEDWAFRGGLYPATWLNGERWNDDGPRTREPPMSKSDQRVARYLQRKREEENGDHDAA